MKSSELVESLLHAFDENVNEILLDKSNKLARVAAPSFPVPNCFVVIKCAVASIFIVQRAEGNLFRRRYQ